MFVDANIAREAARRELTQREQEMNESRAAREAHKHALEVEAEERRKQYDLIEKRLRLASATDKSSVGGITTSILAHSSHQQTLPEVAVAEDTRSRVTTYEEAMRKIQDATGVSDVQEVVDRFMVQGETQENLKALQQANAEHLAKLREV